jgi:dimeric dUTPase (all-alpha-NTP-PPase superfamily)
MTFTDEEIYEYICDLTDEEGFSLDEAFIRIGEELNMREEDVDRIYLEQMQCQ